MKLRYHHAKERSGPFEERFFDSSGWCVIDIRSHTVVDYASNQKEAVWKAGRYNDDHYAGIDPDFLGFDVDWGITPTEEDIAFVRDDIHSKYPDDIEDFHWIEFPDFP